MSVSNTGRAGGTKSTLGFESVNPPATNISNIKINV